VRVNGEITGKKDHKEFGKAALVCEKAKKVVMERTP